ncbi:uncharacterized protein LOC110987518 [Acanthaster planci]|uniref:Uncharacterized protein LOC110987518 n=1 Tax=Acanthaster planci TaxID=133434 RepID=A0A8B7ZM83_ACAPL|nr:uncharacterized protein LOC110987518 [Acanthaster planci]
MLAHISFCPGQLLSCRAPGEPRPKLPAEDPNHASPAVGSCTVPPVPLGDGADLPDAYLHIPIHEKFRKFLRFEYCGQTYQFRALPFGLSTSPRVFTRIAKTVAAYLRRHDIVIFQYLDDWLIVGRSPNEARACTFLTLDVTTHRGFLVNHEKFAFDPAQRLTYLGAILDLHRGIVAPTPERIFNLQQCVLQYLRSEAPPALALLRLLGRMASLVEFTPWCRLQMRPLQLHLLFRYRPKSDPISTSVPLPTEVRNHLRWWIINKHLLIGHPFTLSRPNIPMATDMLLFGRGASLTPFYTSGFGMLPSATNTSTCWNFRQYSMPFATSSSTWQVSQFESRATIPQWWRTSTTEAVLAPPSFVSLHSRSSCGQLIMEPLCRPLPRHCPSDRVDSSSERGQADLRGDRMSPCRSLRIGQQYSSFDVLLQVSSPMSLEDGHSTSVLVCILAYAFPPISLIPRDHPKRQETCRILLIAPFWPCQLWFLRLLRLLVR